MKEGTFNNLKTNRMKEKIEDLIWEFENGSINPYDLIKKLKELIA